MADLFLSYVREDESRARTLATLLEREGHSVWWDRHIKGGERFSRQIEAALAAADFVVVLWSAPSIASAWVADEAAAGRDRGCLVPVTLDGVTPPMGFRQFQTIDFSGWSGRRKPPNWRALTEALARARPETAPATPDSRGRQRHRPSRSWVLGGAGAAVIAAGAIAFFLRRPADSTSVSIQPAMANPASVAAAADLATRLGSMAATDASQFQLTSDSAGRGKSALVVQVRAADDPQKSSRDVSLVSGKDGSILWAARFEQPKDLSGDLAPQLSAATGRVLSCAADSLLGKFPRLAPATLKLYLNACAQLAEQSGETSPDLAPLFRNIVASQPRFAPAWDKLLEIESAAVSGEPGSPLTPALGDHLRKAREMGADVAGVDLAKSALAPSNDFSAIIGALESGIVRHPQSAALHSTLSAALLLVGRREDAIEQARAASNLDPLSPFARGNFIFALAHSGQLERAWQELAAAERLWPGATALRWVRFSLELRYGDPNAALKLVQQGAIREGAKMTEAYLAARIHPTPGNVDLAIANARVVNRQAPNYVTGLATTLATFGKTDEALAVLLRFNSPAHTRYQSELLFRPAMEKVRRDPRFIEAMNRMGLLAYWKKSGEWPDFCFDPKLPYDCRKEAAKYG